MRTANPLTVARAPVGALVPSDSVGRSAVAHLIVAVALVRELDAGEVEALRRAEAGAGRACHARARGRCTGQRAAVPAFSNASDLAPSGRERGLRGNEAGGGLGPARGPSTGAIPEGVATGKRREGRGHADGFVDDAGLEDTCIRRLLVEVRGERGTVHDVPVRVGAVVDGVLEEIDVPTVLEVAVVSVARGVSVGEDPSAGSPEVEVVHGDQHLVEERDELDGVGVRTVAAVEVLDRIGHVRLVVRRVDVLAVPAGGEEYLGAQSIGTAVIEEVRTLGPVGVVVVRSAEVYTENE